MTILFFVFGLTVIIAGAESLNRGAVSLASKLRISPIIIGLTVVAFGTSAPELVVSVTSALRNEPELAIANIVGSNITNILLILGATVAILPLKLNAHTVKREIPFAILSVIALLLFVNNSWLGSPNTIINLEGGVLIALFLLFLTYLTSLARTKQYPTQHAKEYSWALSIGLIIFGCAGLLLGGEWVVDNALSVARIIGFSETLVGLTIVAIGTSLPELVTSIVAAVHKQDGIAVGNVIGSNVFNILWVLGFTSMIQPLPVSSALNFDMLIMLAVTGLPLGCIALNRKHLLRRWHGVSFLLLYIVYLIYIVNRG